jgi:hypothetical protein
MTWTYSGRPGDTDRDTVRFLIHDTDGDDPKLSDEEIAWLLSTEGGPRSAAIAACSQLATRYASLVTSKSVGGMSISYANRATEYRQLAKELRARAALNIAAYAGGISKADKEAVASDDDYGTYFSVGMHDNAGTGETIHGYST